MFVNYKPLIYKPLIYKPLIYKLSAVFSLFLAVFMHCQLYIILIIRHSPKYQNVEKTNISWKKNPEKATFSLLKKPH